MCDRNVARFVTQVHLYMKPVSDLHPKKYVGYLTKSWVKQQPNNK